MPGPAGRRDASEGLGDAEGGHGSAFCSALPPGRWDLPGRSPHTGLCWAALLLLLLLLHRGFGPSIVFHTGRESSAVSIAEEFVSSG